MAQVAILKSAADEAQSFSWTYEVGAEQAVVGGLLLDNDALDRVVDIVSAADFFRSDHRVIFQVIVDLLHDQKPADILTVAERLEHMGKLADVGGQAYLGSLAANTPSAANIRRYAEIVRERSIARALFAAGVEIADSVREPGARTMEDLVDQAQAQVLAVEQRRARGRQAFQTLDTLMIEVTDYVDSQHERHKAGDTVTGVTTGFVDLDHMTGGLQPGQLVILAARPSMGKSALSLNMGEHGARKTGRWVLYFNLEMGNREQGLRTLGAAARVTVQRLASGRIYDHEWARIAEAAPKMRGVKVAFNENAALTIMELRSLVRRATRELGPLCMVVVDYLQLMLAGETEMNRANQLAEISRGLKLLAKEMQIPVMALSQLNRSLEQRANKRPMMSDLRESGALEQDADMILFIYRDEVYHKNTEDRGVAEIIIGKQRNGPIGTVKLHFSGEHTRFENLARQGSE